MTNTYKPHLDQQPKSDNDRKNQQAAEADREKPSKEPVDFEEHDNRLGGDPDVPRQANQSQNGQNQKQGTGNVDR